METPQHTGRLEVWACTHLWIQNEREDSGAADQIAEAAMDLLLDAGANVALCDHCAEFSAFGIPLARKYIVVSDADEGLYTILETYDAKGEE